MASHRRVWISTPVFLVALLALASPASAQKTAPILAIPISEVPPQPNDAVLYALKIRLPGGQGLARMLIQAGVSQADAAAAAKLAAGHLGDGSGGCDAKIEISGALNGGSYRLQRAVLLTASGQTVIEWRAGELTIASQQLARTGTRLV